MIYPYRQLSRPVIVASWAEREAKGKTVEKVGGGKADKVGERVTEWKKTQERRLQLRELVKAG